MARLYGTLHLTAMALSSFNRLDKLFDNCQYAALTHDCSWPNNGQSQWNMERLREETHGLDRLPQ
jgi:hypothetical protein